MKAYGIFPAFDLADASDPRVQACITLVTDIVCNSLREGGDRFQHAIDWREPGGRSWTGGFSESELEAHVVDLGDADALRTVVRFSVDCFDGRRATAIRSVASCRTATFGYDGQAFLLLGLDDAAPVTPDASLVIVEERPELITQTDYFD